MTRANAQIDAVHVSPGAIAGGAPLIKALCCDRDAPLTDQLRRDGGLPRICVHVYTHIHIYNFGFTLTLTLHFLGIAAGGAAVIQTRRRHSDARLTRRIYRYIYLYMYNYIHTIVQMYLHFQALSLEALLSSKLSAVTAMLGSQG